MRGDNLTIATAFKQPFCACCSVGFYIQVYFSYIYFSCKETHRRFQRVFWGMKVAFVGLSLTAVALDPLCWDSPEVGGFQRRAEPRDFPPRLGFPWEGGWRRGHGAEPPRLEHPHLLVVGKGQETGGK